jgi:NAD-dependent SIR2 family protein deacetylase
MAHDLPTDGLVVVLTGAGISAESGIPTFRGAEGAAGSQLVPALCERS